MVRLDGVGLRYGRSGGPDILRDLNFAIPEGGFRWLLGASGAGKTSLLRLLTLAVRPTSGRLELLGTAIEQAKRRDLPKLRRRIGVVYQDFRLLPHLSAFDNVALPLRLAGRPEGQIRADVEEMMRWVTLTRRAHAHPHELSGGEQQRVAIARAIVSGPQILILDEPTASLDGDTGKMIIAFVKEKVLNKDRCIVIVTHDARINEYADRIIHMEDGRITGLDKGTE